MIARLEIMKIYQFPALSTVVRVSVSQAKITVISSDILHVCRRAEHGQAEENHEKNRPRGFSHSKHLLFPVPVKKSAGSVVEAASPKKILYRRLYLTPASSKILSNLCKIENICSDVKQKYSIYQIIKDKKRMSIMDILKHKKSPS